VRVASIGKAGEKLVRFACIVNDHGRVAGRAGFGAVMGSKNLKAIAVAGHTEKPVFKKDEFKRIARDLAKCLVDAPGLLFGEYGTPSGIMPLNALGILPTKNFQEGTFSEAEKISGDTLHDTILAGRDTCTGCPLRCKRVVKTSFDGREVIGPGPEYETIAAFGSLCLNSDLSSIALANQLCNQHGLDTISTGVTIAFALEAVEKGLLRGLDLRWGDAKGIVRVVELIANREGIGDVLAEGACEAAKKLGADFAQTIKGQEIPLHDPRGKTGLAISYATSPRGGTHVEGLHDTLFTTTPVTSELGVAGKLNRFLLPGKAKIVKAYEDLASFNNSLVMCRLVAYSRVGERYLYPKLRESLLALTGEEFDARRVLAIGERNYILLRIAAAKRGYGRREDTLTDRLMSPLPSGPSGGVPIDRSEWMEALREYYEARGYDDNGHPTQEKITALELDLDSVRF